jgi:tetratricopeptide (TPR) repeat protein
MKTQRVFLSHTSDMALFPGGRSFVQAALDAVGRARLAPVDMRYFAARDERPADYCQEQVRASDIYIAIVGFRYGSLVPGTGISYTELEFKTATNAGLPRLIFLLTEAACLAGLADTDRSPVEGFRARLTDAGLLIREFNSSDTLEMEVFHALSELTALSRDCSTEDHPAVLATSQEGSTKEHERAQEFRKALMRHNYFGGLPFDAEAPVSIAPPVGQRDERFPLRGRDSLLSELRKSDASPGVRVIHGMGGSGKTSLALEAAHLASQRGVEVWWVSAAEKLRFLAGMRALGRRLGMADDELRHGEAADLLWRRLSGRRQEWLLVIDNADDLQVLAGPGSHTADGTGWLRPVAPQFGLVLVTSRDGHAESWGSWCRLHSVGMLTVGEATQVLADRTGAHHEGLGGNTGAESLALRLGRLPLALRIAGSFLAELAEIPPAFAGPAPVRSYLQYQDVLEQGNLHAVFPSDAPGALTSDEARNIIDRTWELTLDQLESRQFPEARGLLRLLAFLADAPIPYELVLCPPILADSPLFAGIVGPRLWQVLQALAGHDLIQMADGRDEATPRIIRLHPLVRDTSRAGASRSEQEGYLTLAARLLRAAATHEVTGSPADPRSWSRWHVLAPHALHVFELVSTTAGYPDETRVYAAHAASEAASYQATQGLIRPAEATHRKVLQVRQELLGADDPATIDTRHDIARRLAERGEYGQAETEYRDALEAARRILGPEHPDTLGLRHNLAALLSFRGNYAEAEAEYRDVLAAELNAVGQDHYATLSTRHEIARMMAIQGRHAEAEEEFRDVLAARIRISGSDNYYTLVTRSQVARMMAAQGQHAEAEQELRDILAAQTSILGPEHLRTLWTRQQIALMMASLGDYSGAENELRDVLAVRQSKVPDHPDTLAARHELARMLAAQGNTTEARDEFQAVLAAKMQVLGPDHPSTALTTRAIESLTSNQTTPFRSPILRKDR